MLILSPCRLFDNSTWSVITNKVMKEDCETHFDEEITQKLKKWCPRRVAMKRKRAVGETEDIPIYIREYQHKLLAMCTGIELARWNLSWTNNEENSLLPRRNWYEIDQAIISKMSSNYPSLKCTTRIRPIQDVPYLGNNCDYPRECGLAIDCDVRETPRYRREDKEIIEHARKAYELIQQEYHVDNNKRGKLESQIRRDSKSLHQFMTLRQELIMDNDSVKWHLRRAYTRICLEPEFKR